MGLMEAAPEGFLQLAEVWFLEFGDVGEVDVELLGHARGALKETRTLFLAETRGWWEGVEIGCERTRVDVEALPVAQELHFSADTERRDSCFDTGVVGVGAAVDTEGADETLVLDGLEGVGGGVGAIAPDF